MPAPEEMNAPTWLVFTPVREPASYTLYAPPADRARHDPETLMLDVPARPRPFRWTDEVSLWGVGLGGLASIVPAVFEWDPTFFIMFAGLGLLFDVCRTGWRVARELHERSQQTQLGRTTMTFTDEGFRCTSYAGQEASASWTDVDRVTVGFAGVGLGSVHVWWRPAGSTDDVDIEIGPGTDLVEIHRAFMRHSAPQLAYVSERQDDASGNPLPPGPDGHRAV